LPKKGLSNHFLSLQMASKEQDKDFDTCLRNPTLRPGDAQSGCAQENGAIKAGSIRDVSSSKKQVILYIAHFDILCFIVSTCLFIQERRLVQWR